MEKSGYLLLIETAIVSYLLGSIPSGYLLVKAVRGEDVRSSGSGNIGATNVARTGGAKLGVLTLVLDVVKGFVAVYLAGALALRSPFQEDHGTVLACMSVAVLFAMVGHMFPVWLKFKGGKGVATGLGCFLALAPRAVLVSLVVFAAVVIVSRYVSLASIVASAAFPVFVFLIYRHDSSPAVLAATVAASLLIIVKHRANIGRLMSGTENRLSFSGKKA